MQGIFGGKQAAGSVKCTKLNEKSVINRKPVLNPTLNPDLQRTMPAPLSLTLKLRPSGSQQRWSRDTRPLKQSSVGHHGNTSSAMAKAASAPTTWRAECERGCD